MEYAISKLAPTIYIPTGMNVTTIELTQSESEDWPCAIEYAGLKTSAFTSTER